MARARQTAGPIRSPTVHNDGSETVTASVVVRAPDVTAETVTLAPTATTTVDAPPAATVEVHTDGGSAAAPAHTEPNFVVREGSVLVAPE